MSVSKHGVLIIEAAVLLATYCLSSLGSTANQISRLACIYVGLHTGTAYIEEQVVYVGNIPGKTIQWGTRKQFCSVIKIIDSLICTYVLLWRCTC